MTSTTGTTITGTTTTTTASSAQRARRHRRSLALAVALAAGGALFAPLPAHAATQPSDGPTWSTTSPGPSGEPDEQPTEQSDKRPTATTTASPSPSPRTTAPTTAPTTSRSTSPTTAPRGDDEDAATFDPDAPVPQAKDPDDQNALERAWAKIKDLVIGDDDEEDQGEDQDDEKSGDQATDDSPDERSTNGDVPVLPAASNSTTLTAEGFVNSVGVGTHLAYLDTSYGDVDAVKLVEDLGVLHVRDGLGSADSVPIKSMQRLGQAGVDINWVAQPADSSFSIDDQLDLIKDNKLNVTSVEGVNEEDNHGNSNWVSEVREHQIKLYSAVKDTLGDDVAVVAPSLVHDESRAQLGEVPSDIANSHPYTGGEMQTASATEHQLSMTKEVTPDVDTATPEQVEGKKVDLKAAVEDSGAMWATETGFHTATDSTAGGGVQPHVSEKAQAVLEVQQVLANYRNGVDRSYIYELMDEGDDNGEAEDRFGLAHADGSPKPVYTALQQLLATVATGGPSGTVGAAPVTVDVTGGSDVTTSVVLPRADGSTVVAVWEASPVWDRDASRDLDVPAHDVTLHLGGDVDAPVFVPGQGTKALESTDDTSSVKVSSQAAPTIVVLAPTGASSSDQTSSDDPPAADEPTSTPTPTASSTSSTLTRSQKPTPLDTAGPKVDEQTDDATSAKD